MEPMKMEKIINKRRYSTRTATLIASDCYWDGHNCERRGRNHFLYRTPKGNHFLVTQTLWQGEQDQLEPISEEEAIALYEGDLSEHYMGYEEAFPDVIVEDA